MRDITLTLILYISEVVTEHRPSEPEDASERLGSVPFTSRLGKIRPHEVKGLAQDQPSARRGNEPVSLSLPPHPLLCRADEVGREVKIFDYSRRGKKLQRQSKPGL